MADRDYYEVLGLSRDATPEQIKKAYRGMARKYHPDLNPGDKAAETSFKEAQQAYDILSETEKKTLYDRYGHAAFQSAGPQGPRSGASEWAARQGGPTQYENIDLSDLSDLFGSGFVSGAESQHGAESGGGGGGGAGGMFEDILGRVRGGGRARRTGAPLAGRSTRASLTVPFLTAVRGGDTTIDISRQNGQTESLVVKIPPGTDSGAKLRLRGRGEPGQPPGDLVIEVAVQPHAYFQREGRDITVEVPITVSEAILGAKVDVPMLDGVKTLSIPAGTSTGQRLRLRGQGVPGSGNLPSGDLFIIPKVVVPKSSDDESRRLIREFAEKNPQTPRSGLW